MRHRIKFSSQTMRPIELFQLSQNVVNKMTGNPIFPTPIIPLADLTAKAAELEVAINIATEGSRLERSERDILYRELSDLLNKQADYVRSICNGDKHDLLSSGFELVKEPEPIGIPGVTIIKDIAMTGIEGQVEIKWKTVRGAKVYQVWMSSGDPNDKASWQPVAATHRVTLKVDNLKSLTAYWFTISAIGAAGEGAKCDPAKGVAA